MVKKIVFIVIAWKIILLLVAYLATLILPLQKTFTAYNYGVNPNYYLWIWGNFDGYHYMEIAERGYRQLEYGFFPLFPLLIRGAVNLFKIPYLVAGQSISLICFLFSFWIIYKLLKIDKKEYLFNILLLVILFFPTSFFYSAIYNDSLFLLLAILTIYFARKKKWIAASALGSLATLTRLNGLALFFLIVLEYIDEQKIKKAVSFKNIVRDKIYSVSLIPFTFAGYFIYIAKTSGNWNSLSQSMNIWGQNKAVFPLQVFWRYLKILFLTKINSSNFFVAFFELFFVLFYIYILIWSFKKIRLSYWIFFAVSILIPMLTGTFQGMPRYGLHIYPFFLALTMLLYDKSLFKKLVYFIVSFILLFLYLAFFTRGYFVA